MGTTTESYQRKKRERPNQKKRRQKNSEIKGAYAPGTQFGNTGSPNPVQS